LGVFGQLNRHLLIFSNASTTFKIEMNKVGIHLMVVLEAYLYGISGISLLWLGKVWPLECLHVKVDNSLHFGLISANFMACSKARLLKFDCPLALSFSCLMPIFFRHNCYMLFDVNL